MYLFVLKVFYNVSAPSFQQKLACRQHLCTSEMYTSWIFIRLSLVTLCVCCRRHCRSTCQYIKTTQLSYCNYILTHHTRKTAILCNSVIMRSETVATSCGYLKADKHVKRSHTGLTTDVFSGENSCMKEKTTSDKCARVDNK